MKIIHRMMVAFGCLLAIGLVQGGVSLTGLNVLKGQIEHATMNPLHQIDAARGIWEAYGDALAELDTARNAVRFEPSQDLLARYRTNLNRIEKHIEELKRSSPSAGIAAKLAQAERTFSEWNSGALTLLGDKPTVSIPAPHKMAQLGKTLRHELQDLVDTARNDAAATAASIVGRARMLEFLVIGCVVFAAIAGGILALLASLSLSKPLVQVQGRMRALMEGDIMSAVPHQTRRDEIGAIAQTVEFMKMKLVERDEMQKAAAELEKRAQHERAEAERETLARERDLVNASIGAAMERLANKDLAFRLTEPLPNAYARLQSNFNAAVEQLEAAMRSVSARTDAITQTSGEMSNAASDLSRRTEQQAASLEETVSALDEITVTVKRSAEEASRARNIVEQAKKSAEDTGSVVRHTIDAMGDIEKSSQQINQIIGVIDEIAFQTNLLALNAGVEAARAGDSGRGFAVVASEVRALAQRSAQAAKEIKELISRSSTLVGSGVSLVSDTGAALNVIIRQVAEINQAIASIASGAQEQAAGVQDVNNSINEMDRFTQQNAAMVEQATASSVALVEEAQGLRDCVGEFRITAQNQPSVSPMPRTAKQRTPRSAPSLSVSRSSNAVRRPVAAPEAEEWSDF